MSSRAVRKALKRLEAQKELEKGLSKDIDEPVVDDDEEEGDDDVPPPVNPFAMVSPAYIP
jgi:hypothetical protein